MSNSLAIAAVTRTLRNLLNHVTTADFSGLPDDTRPTAEIQVTTLPLDRVRNGESDSGRNQVNLFLYHAEPSPAYRNMDLPRQVRPNETGRPPLALNLYYLITAYGQGDSELVAHVLLGTAMRVLHDHPVLSRAEIRSALALGEVDTQFENVRVTPQPVSLDEVSKLWTGFQSEYRLSAAYQVSVVLIESLRSSVAPLPVLNRGEADRGPVALAAPGPTLTKVEEIFDPGATVRPPHGKPAAELGDVLVLGGTSLGADPLTARFRHLRRDTALELPPLPERADTRVQVQLPAAGGAGIPSQWPAGMYSVEMVVQRPDVPAWTTNPVPFALGPTLDSITPLTRAVGAQPFDLTIECRPQVLDGQRVSLLLGSRELAPESVTTPNDPDAATTLVFEVSGLAEGPHVVRLRVDGADSVPIDFAATPPAFDATQTLTITP
ncbi:MAG TPA: DUF4255 domain-containing protein [Longimicrobium sp.]|jgi:hypothetical protein|nr:DUF4255 domain-containing protein [Longimicrobium sp.]